MSEILKCELNVPSEIALKFPDGINVQSQYGMKVLYTLVDERKFFAPPFLADKIKNLKIGPGERFSICKKTGEGNKVQWEIKRVAPPASGPELVAPAHSQAATVGASQNTQHSNGNRQETLTQLGNVLVNGVPENGHQASPKPAPACLMTGQSQFCLQQLIAAIEAVHAAEKYAKAMNRPVTFTSEDIRAFAISCFIQQHRGTY